MKLLAISGSAREVSTNTSLLRSLCDISPPDIDITVFEALSIFPVFSPDTEGENTPEVIKAFCTLVRQSDGLIISSPEYVRAIPGGLKNAIDWLVSRDEIVNKPIVLVHASHRGDDMLQSLRLVLSTVTARFDEQHFLRIPLMSKSPDEVRRIMSESRNVGAVKKFIADFCGYID